jgi:hypothetical protein
MNRFGKVEGKVAGEMIGGTLALVEMGGGTTIGEEATVAGTDRRHAIEVAEIQGWQTVFSLAECDHNGRQICR